MIGRILRKELLVNMLSLRFIIGLVVTTLMMGLVGFVLVQDYASRRQAYLGDVQSHTDGLRDVKVYSMVSITMDIPPSPLSIFSRGTKDLPSSITVSPYHIPSILDQNESGESISLEGNGTRPVNPLLRMFSSIDISFVVGIVFSLLAILFVFDSFSGGRGQGTLRLLLSNPAGRLQILAGKFLGALLTIAVPLTIGFLEVVLLGRIYGGISFTAGEWGGILFLYAVSLLFLAAFLALGLFVSLFARESSTGLMYLLLAWVVIAVALPAGGTYVAEFWNPGRSESALAKEVNDHFNDAVNKIPYKYVDGWNGAWCSYDAGEKILGLKKEEALNRIEFNKKVFPMKFQLAEDLFKVRDQFRRELEKKEQVRTLFDLLSPSALLGDIAQRVAGTSPTSYQQAHESARQYRNAMMEYLRPRVATASWFTRIEDYPDMEPTQENNRYWDAVAAVEGPDVYFSKRWTWDRVSGIDLKDMPQPTLQIPGMRERVGESLSGVSLLALYGLVLLVLAGWKLTRYAV